MPHLFQKQFNYSEPALLDLSIMAIPAVRYIFFSNFFA
jgi:hypothetical protein